MLLYSILKCYGHICFANKASFMELITRDLYRDVNNNLYTYKDCTEFWSLQLPESLSQLHQLHPSVSGNCGGVSTTRNYYDSIIHWKHEFIYEKN
jgi:hypothetical protein